MLERGVRQGPRPRTVQRLAGALGLDRRQTEALIAAARRRSPEPPGPRAGLPPDPDPYFIGRERELRELLRQLREARRVVVHGLGGVGKTQLAARYVQGRRAAYPDGVFWVRADTESSLLGDLASLARHLALPEREQHQQERQVAAVLGWLRDHGRWLLVLDNLEPAARDAAERWLPTDLPGHLLVTSRTPQWPVRLGLEPLPVETARWFLLRRTGQDDARAAGEVAEALGRLPLALAQAAAYLDITGRDLGSYSKLLRTRLVELMGEAPPEGYAHTVTTTWQLSFQRLEVDCPAAIALLRLCAVLAPDDIPISVLQAGAGIVPAALRNALADDLELDRALGALRRYSLAERDGDRLRVHRLVQAVVRETTSASDRAAWLSAAVRLLDAVLPDEPDQHPEHWPLCARVVAHVHSVELLIGDQHVQPHARSSVLTRAGIYLFARGEYRSARLLLQRALDVREQVLGPDHPDTADSLDNVALTLYALHEPVAARMLFERALAIRECTLGLDHPLTAVSLGHVAMLQQNEGELATARVLYERELAINEQVRGPEHPYTVKSLTDLATLLKDQGEVTAAADLMERALSICDRTFGSDHLLTSRVLDGFALLHLSRGEPAAARSLAERAVAIRERVLGLDHRHTAMSLDHLASAVMGQGELETARALLEQAVAIRERVLGIDHPHTADSIDNLGTLLQKQGDGAGARALVEWALTIRERTLGPDHPDTAASLDNLAILLVQQSDASAAMSLVQRALAIRERCLGPDHPDTARSRRLVRLGLDGLGAQPLRAAGTSR